MADDLPLLDALVQVSLDVTAVLTAVAAQHDLSLTQLRVLAILRDRDREPTLAQLADHLGLDRSTITGLIDRAQKRGLVRRVAHAQDKRSAHVTLTEAGHALAPDLEAEIGRRLAPLTDALNARERERLRALLARLLTR
jgi:MarR family transcriptional regulator, lower aerobic nicotinate degradation pathway regulator